MGAWRSLWERWKRFGRKIGDFQARLLLSLFYYTVLAPFALVVRCASDPLGIKPGASRGWTERTEAAGSPLERAGRQY